MDPISIALITIILLVMAIVLGSHVSVALAMFSAIGLLLITGNLHLATTLLGNTAFNGIKDYIYGTLPMFLLMGLFADVGGASEDVYEAANVVLRRIRGGIGIATVIANAIFAAVTGISVGSAVMFSKIALPQMERLGYDKKFSLGIVASSSLLGQVIPPSGILIIYGIISEEAIGKLFIAGILPGILMSLVLSIGIIGFSSIRKGLIAKPPEYQKMDRSTYFKTVGRPWGVFVLVFIVLGGLYGGVFTPTEAGAIGAFGAFLLALMKGRLSISNVWKILQDVGNSTACICILLICAQMYSRMLAISGSVTAASNFVISLPLPPIVIIYLFVALWVILGCFLDSVSIYLLTLPVMLPVARALGIDFIHFGMIILISVEIGLLTPPFGIVVYAMSSALDKKATAEEIFAGSFPFLLLLLIILVIVIHVPWISLWLPSLM